MNVSVAEIHQNFMNLAVKEAIESTEAPFGAIVVKDGQIVGAGSHMVGSHNDITSHAEIVAIRKACSSLGSPSLSGCSIYTSSHPCGMCLGACLYAGITEVYYAASLREVADEGFSNNTGRINLCPFWIEVLASMTVIADSQATKEKEAKSVGAGKKTPWKSINICVFMQFIIGIQISLYYMSMWPYLSGLDPSATVDFLGWVIAACSFGCSIANPIFGFWNEKNMSVKQPTIFGFVLAAAGQLLYALLPLFLSNQKWIMIAARVLTGFGTGCISVLRAYTATAPIPEQRLRAISFGTAGWVLGLSLGPAIQACFTPIGDGWTIGYVVFNMYTLPAFVIVALTVIACPLVWIFLDEEYAGVINDKEKEASNIEIPKYNMTAAMVCVWNWVCFNMIATNIEVMSTPMSTVMYGWNDGTSVLYNGIMQSVSCIASFINYFVIGYTRVGNIDKRKQIIFGLSMFVLYHLVTFPWPFYPGPLKFIPDGKTTAEVGGCDPSYSWCASTVSVPLPIYVFCFIFIFGFSFPFVGSPSASLYSEILGPRPQGMMQGMYSFGGSVAQFLAPVFATLLFKYTGYMWIIVMQLSTLGVGLFLMIIFYKQLVPLEVKPVDDQTTRKVSFM